MKSVKVLLVLCLTTLIFPPLGASAETDRLRIAEAVLRDYIHGVTPEIALQEVGLEGVPTLLELLADPRFPRRDNVLAFLTHLADDEHTPQLLAFLANPPRNTEIPEEDRALLLAPRALGRLAERGGARALEALLGATAHASDGGRLAAGMAKSRRPSELRDDLIEGAVEGLSRTHLPAAEERLRAIAEGRVIPIRGKGRNFRGAARRALEQTQPQASVEGQSGITDAAAADEIAEDLPVGAAADTQAVTHSTGFDYLNHAAQTSPMTDARLDDVLAKGSLIMGRADHSTDISCCVSFHRRAAGGSFGQAGDGMDVIDNNTELNTVLNNRAARVKVVRAINYCGGTGTNIIGCAWIGGYGMALVRRTDVWQEAKLWLHEYGHNVGLQHHTDSRNIMYGALGSSSTANVAVSQAECNTYHAPSSGTLPDLSGIGQCADGDADGVHDLEDNCPTRSNFDQLDSNGDGAGDACGTAGGCGNNVKEGSEQCDGTALGGATCQTLGYTGGALRCSSQCQYDTAACTSAVCGNNTKEGAEQCDGTALGGATCASLGYAGGTLSCSSTCRYNTSACATSVCGNNTREGSEQCDGTALGAATCQSLGYAGGTLRCSSTCGYDTSGCVSAYCGNNTREGAEQCDGSALGGATCQSLGFAAGALRCSGTCQYDTSACSSSACGNSIREDGEQCDGGALGGATCQSLDYATGTLGCSAACVYDTSGCRSASSSCDFDGACESGESCLTCPSDCASGRTGYCGNGICETAVGEDCVSCPSDCRGRQDGRTSRRYCCGDGGGQRPVSCADSRCRNSGFRCNTRQPVSSCCGDGICTGGLEDAALCGVDCGLGRGEERNRRPKSNRRR